MHRSGTSKALKDIEEAILQEQSFGSMLTTLSSLVRVAETTVGQADIDAEQMNELAGYMAEIRHLLGHVRCTLHQPAVVQESRNIAARYRELEGRVKELRNDRVANGK